MREAVRLGDVSKVANVWMNAVCFVEHNLVLQHFDEDGAAHWGIALDSLDRGATLVWPVAVKSINVTYRYFEFLDVSTDFPLAPWFDLENTSAYEFTWRSYAWQRLQFGSLSPAPVGIRPIVVGGPKRLMDIMVDAAFWHLPNSFVEKVAQLVRSI